MARSRFQRNIIRDNVTYNGTLVNTTTVVGATGTFDVGGRKSMTLDIVGTAITPTIWFYGAGASTTPRNITGQNLTTSATAVSASSTPTLWSFDVRGITTFSVVCTPTSPVSTSNVAIYYKAVP